MEMPFHRSEGYRDDQRAKDWFADGGAVPEASPEPCDVLQTESQVCGMDLSEAKRLKQLEDENVNLYSDQTAYPMTSGGKRWLEKATDCLVMRPRTGF